MTKVPKTSSRMILLASSCGIVIITILIATAQAIYTAPVTDNLRSLMSFDVNYGGKTRDIRGSNIQTTADTRPTREEEQTVYVIEFESEPSENNSDKGRKGNDGESNMSDISPLDPWSIVWYIGSFGGLVAFFLFVSCSEWCCRRGARSTNTPQHPGEAAAANSSRGVSETPPPPYHLFAPPPYDSIHYGQVVDKTGEKKDIYVISLPAENTTQQPAPA